MHKLQITDLWLRITDFFTGCLLRQRDGEWNRWHDGDDDDRHRLRRPGGGHQRQAEVLDREERD